MKNIFKITFIVTLLLSAVSCLDAVDIEQPGIMTSDLAYQTVDDLQLGLIGCYGMLDNTFEIGLNALYTDEVSIGLVNGGQGVNEYALELTPVSFYSTVVWSTKYVALSHVNKLIVGANSITPEADEQQLYNNILGQAYSLRAYLHFELLTYYSTDLTDDNALGIIALDYPAGTDEELPRNTNAEVYNLITTDLDKAANLVNDNNGVTFIGKDFIIALRARMAAYRGDYVNAEIYASQLLNNYPLAPFSEFENVFSDQSEAGIIFKLERTAGDNYDGQGTMGGGTAGSLFAFSASTLGGSPFIEMSRSLFNKIDVSDVRYATYIDESSIIDTDYMTSENFLESDVLIIRKYPGSEGTNLLNDLKIFRASEMLFILAEAKADAGNYAEVATLLKQLEDLRLDADTPLLTITNEEEAFAAILASRRIELALEGFRWVDLKRLGVRANVEIDRDPRDCEVSGVCSMSATDHRFTLPIPLRELDVNNQLVQNPGY